VQPLKLGVQSGNFDKGDHEMKKYTLIQLIVVGAVAMSVTMSALPSLASEPAAHAYGRAIPVQSTMVRYIRALVTMHIRSGPGYGYDVIERVYAGNKLPVTGLSMDGRWWRVPCPPGGTIGDCFMARNRYWNIPARPDSPNEPFPVVSTAVKQIRALGNVNIRSGPNAGYSRLGYLHQGAITAVHGVSVDGHWYQVDCPEHGVNGNCFVTDNELYTEPAN
jgi:uncharacterized protein YgiM (DUF1202 family)